MQDREQLIALTNRIISAALAVHSHLGPGLLESTYEACLAYELEQRGIRVEQQKPLPLVYKDLHIDAAYRLDLLVDDLVIVEIKAVENLLPIHTAQLLTYLKLTQLRVGLLINFNTPMLKEGIRRVVNKL